MLSIKTFHIDQNLRARLLASSIGIAIAVSAIFIIVAYRLSADLGQSTELQSIELQTQILFSQLNDGQKQADPDKLIASFNNANQKNTEQDEKLFYLELKIKDKTYKHEGLSESPTQTLLLAESYNPNSSGLILISENRFMWAERSTPDKQQSILLIRPTTSLDQALEYVVRRLSVTAFLTFWIAVWSALLLSAIIVRRIDKNNKELAFIATHDSLTHLPNRLYLIDTVNQHTESYLTSNKAKALAKGALLMIDLDRFKEVNDTLGHAMGDELLIALAKRFRENLDDSCLLVRTGGDEFIIWSKDMDAQSALAVANQIIQSCKEPVNVNNTFLESSASIGIACFPQHGDNVDTLAKCADVAMYQAKRQRQGFKIYDAASDHHSLLSIKLRGELRNALKEQQFILYYQPKVELSTGKIIGVEALTRWEHPQEGLIYPNEFIELIEQSGMVNEFSRYVLLSAVKQLRLWLDQNINLNIAVNISPYNLLDPTLTPYIQTILKTHKVPAAKLEIELTETASMIDINKTKKVFQQLKKTGVKLSVDDFGTGMSSLAYLKELDVDFIKIDRSFIINMSNDYRDEAIVKSIIDLTSRLGRHVVAEGIENADIAKKLASMGCGFGQGYYFAQPMPEEKLLNLIYKNTD